MKERERREESEEITGKCHDRLKVLLALVVMWILPSPRFTITTIP